MREKGDNERERGGGYCGRRGTEKEREGERQGEKRETDRGGVCGVGLSERGEREGGRGERRRQKEF